MTDYSSDSQGRPVSEDGLWVWTGTEWEPTAAQSAATTPDLVVEPAEGLHDGLRENEAVVELRAPVIAEPAANPRSKRPSPSRSRASRSGSLASSGGPMTLGRLVTTTLGVLLASGGAAAVSAYVAIFMTARAVQSALEQPTFEPGASSGPNFAGFYLFVFTLSTLAVFCVLHAAQIPKALLGAVLIVVSSSVVTLVLPNSLALIGPVWLAIATASFISKASR